MATLDQLLSTLPTDSGQKGKAWERLCQWFLLNDPVYASQLRRVWRCEAISRLLERVFGG